MKYTELRFLERGVLRIASLTGNSCHNPPPKKLAAHTLISALWRKVRPDDEQGRHEHQERDDRRDEPEAPVAPAVDLDFRTSHAPIVARCSARSRCGAFVEPRQLHPRKLVLVVIQVD